MAVLVVVVDSEKELCMVVVDLVQLLQLTSQLVLVGQFESGKVDRLVKQPF